MLRYFFIAENLEDIEKVEHTMALEGFTDNQYHVLSNDDSTTQKRKLHDVASIFKQDLIHSGEIGALVGISAAGLLLLTVQLAGWANTSIGWLPFWILAFMVFCFCTWEGAFLGFQIPNSQFKKFSRDLKEGRHIFFVDVYENQKSKFEPIMKWYPELKQAGTGSSVPAWFLKTSHNLKEAIKALP